MSYSHKPQKTPKPLDDTNTLHTKVYMHQQPYPQEKWI